MKKIIATIVLVVILTLSLGMAQAEVRVCGFSHMGPVTDGVYKAEEWFVSYKLDHSDCEISVAVSQQEYNKLVAAYEAEAKLDKSDRESKWYRKATNWICGAGKDVADFVVFWD